MRSINATQNANVFRYVAFRSRPMPRSSLGDKSMTNAQRQARYRAAGVAARPVIHCRRAADPRSRARRWHEAVAELGALQANMPLGSTLSRKPCATALPARRCRRSSISISTISSPSSSHADTDATKPLAIASANLGTGHA